MQGVSAVAVLHFDSMQQAFGGHAEAVNASRYTIKLSNSLLAASTVQVCVMPEAWCEACVQCTNKVAVKGALV